MIKQSNVTSIAIRCSNMQNPQKSLLTIFTNHYTSTNMINCTFSIVWIIILGLEKQYYSPFKLNLILFNKQTVMDFLKKCCQCYCFSGAAYNVALCIDSWHSCEACGLAYLYCDACYWTLFSPLCIECKLGDTGKAMENCSKCLKYCVFSCALSCVGCVDGCYNCFMIIKQACGEGVKGYADLTKNTQFIANKVKSALGLETGNEPLRSMGTFTP